MFWKPKQSKIKHMPIFIEPPLKNYFRTMRQIFENAVLFDERGETEICKATLDVLKQHIDNYGKEPLVKPEFTKDRPNTTSTNKDLFYKNSGLTKEQYDVYRTNRPVKSTNDMRDLNKDEGSTKNLFKDFEHRDISTAKLTGKEVSFVTKITPFFVRKYKGVIKEQYIKKETLIFENEQDAENYFYLETKELNN